MTHMWLILATIVISIPNRAVAATRLIDDFNSAGWLDNWSFVPGEEFPGAKGVLIADEGFQGGGASLQFDFSCVKVIGACNPRYVAASRPFDTPIPGEMLALWVRCDACEPLFRITDATGQRLTYGPVALPLAAKQAGLRHGAESRSVSERAQRDARFDELYGSEDRCREAVFRWRWPRGFVCPGCGRQKHCLTGRVEIDDAYLGGERSGGKRGRGAPGKTPIIVAMETTPEGQPVRLKLRRVNGFRRKEVEKLARRSLDPPSTVVSDGLACFRGVTDAGCTHQPIRTGSGRTTVRTPAFKWVNTALGNIKTAITATYRAIRQKHIPRYLAEFAYRFNRRYDLAAMMPRLGWAAVRTPPMPYRLLKLAEAHA